MALQKISGELKKQIDEDVHRIQTEERELKNTTERQNAEESIEKLKMFRYMNK